MSYIGTEPKDIRSFGRTKFDYTATQGQTAFTGADDDGKVLAFTVGQIEVYVNGILMDDSDFTTTGTGTVTLASAANLNDVVNVVSFETNIPDSNYVPASGGTFTGAVTHTGAFTSKGIDDNADATAITIDTSERVLIGKTSPAFGTVGHTVYQDGSHDLTASAIPPIQANRLSSDGDIAAFFKDGSKVGSIATSGGRLHIGSTEGDDCFIGFGNSIVRPTNSSGASRDANTDLGYTGMRFRDLYLSGGVYLGGTGAANKLSDYETGTFSTSLLQCTTTTPSYSVNANRNKYVKIDKLVLAHFDFSFISLSGGAGDVLLNLPFTVNGTENYHSVHAQRNCSAFSGSIADYKINGYGGANSTLLYLLVSTGNSGAEAAINASSLQNGRINLNFIYTTSD